MRLHSKGLNSRFPTRRPLGYAKARDWDRGYVLMVLMMLATVLLVSLSAALPSIYVAGQREREEELIFRGNEYARAITLFRRQFNRYPVSVKELLETNRLHFLRRAYRDPMSRDGKWRFIHADANGIPIDSRTLTRVRPGQGAKGQSEPSSNSQQMPAKLPGKASTQPSTSSGQAEETKGLFIIGVASTKKRESIRIWNGHARYDEWEFLASVNEPALAPAQPGAPSATEKPGETFPTPPPEVQGPPPPRPIERPSPEQ